MIIKIPLYLRNFGSKTMHCRCEINDYSSGTTLYIEAAYTLIDFNSHAPMHYHCEYIS